MRAGRAGFGMTLGLAAAAALLAAGCGLGATGPAPSLPVPSVGPSATAGVAAAQTRRVIAEALKSVAAESGRLRDAPRAVYQVVLPDQPDAGYVVVYEFPDAASAVDAGNEEAGYLGTGNGRVQFPLGTQHVLRQVGTTLILYSWLPAASSDPTAGNVADALNTLGIGFTVPS